MNYFNIIKISGTMIKKTPIFTAMSLAILTLTPTINPCFATELSNLPTELLYEIGSQLPLKDELAFSATEYRSRIFASQYIQQSKKIIDLTYIPQGELSTLFEPNNGVFRKADGIRILASQLNTHVTNLLPANLKHIKIVGPISDHSHLSHLQRFKNLTTLDLEGTHLSDISPLIPLSSLTTLELGDNSIIDISPVASLKNLTRLSFKGTLVSDILPITKLKKLTTLILWNERLNNVSVLASLTNLTELSLLSCSIRDISALAALKNLKNLSLNWTYVHDIAPLRALHQLEELDLSSTQVNDISALNELKKLKRIFLYGTPLRKEQVEAFRIPRPSCEIYYL
jgi:Leucine-rich repeat (LRR) protein